MTTNEPPVTIEILLIPQNNSMEKLYKQLNDIFQFFTTDVTTGLPLKIGKFTCVPLLSASSETVGYLVTGDNRTRFFRTAGEINLLHEEVTGSSIELVPCLQEEYVPETCPN